MQRSQALALLALTGTLVVGGALGFTVDRLVVRDPCPPTDTHHGLDELSRRLGLTAGQRDAVDSILDKRHRDMSAAFAPIRPQLDSIRIGARAEIFKLLEPRQRARFQQLIDEQQAQAARDTETHHR